MKEFLAHLDRLEGHGTIDAVWQETAGFLAERGITRIGCAYGTVRADQPLGMPFVRGTFSPEIGKRWSTEHIYRDDPVIERAFQSSKPFPWGASFIGSNVKVTVRDFYAQLAADGAASLLVVPLRCDPNRLLGLGYVGNAMHRQEFLDFLATKGELLTLAVLYADSRLVALSRALPRAVSRLAPREKQCLELLGQGLKNEVIAAQLGISTPTVQLHLASAKKKLKASTTAQALATAVRLRIIRS